MSLSEPRVQRRQKGFPAKLTAEEIWHVGCGWVDEAKRHLNGPGDMLAKARSAELCLSRALDLFAETEPIEQPPQYLDGVGPEARPVKP